MYSELPGVTSVLSSIYQRLTKPSGDIRQTDQRRKAQLLAALILIIFVLVWIVEFASIFAYLPEGDYQGYWLSIAFSLVLGLAYYLGRTRYFNLAVWLIVVSLIAQTLYLSVFVDGTVYPGMLYFLAIPFLITSFFLSERVTTLMYAANVGFIGLLAIFLPDPATREALQGPLVLFVAVGGLILALTHNRNLLEEDRRQELARERNLLRTVIDNVPDQIFVRERDNRFLLSNLADARVMGIEDPTLLAGKTDYDFYPPELAARYQADNTAVMESGRARLNLEEPSPDGAGGLRWVLTTKVPLLDPAGQVIGLVGIARDITDLKRSEKERLILEKQLAHEHKLDALGQLAAGMAHEINTPAQYVASNLRFLRNQMAALEAANARVNTVREYISGCWRCSQILPQVEAILPRAKFDYLVHELPLAIDQSLEGIARVTDIVNAMRIFSHPGGARSVPANLNQILEDTLTITHNQWKAVAEVETHFAADLPAVPCFPPQIGQAFLNIILNAVDAISGAAISGAAPADAAAPAGKIIITTCAADGWVEARIADTGPGIPAEIQEQIFDYFFTTKEVGQGTGQGLAICHNIIVKMHGGTLAVESQAGAGATFIVRLPCEMSPTGDGIA